jgi:hypothetical protein
MLVWAVVGLRWVVSQPLVEGWKTMNFVRQELMVLIQILVKAQQLQPLFPFLLLRVSLSPALRRCALEIWAWQQFEAFG